MNNKNLTFEQYKARVEWELTRKHSIGIDDCSDEERVKSAYDSDETVDEFVEWVGDKYDLDDISTYPFSTPRKYFDRKVEMILDRKEAGIDCIEEESAEIKQFVKTTIIGVGDGTQQIIERIQNLFPQEYGEAIDEQAK